jgi:hypothetical protein
MLPDYDVECQIAGVAVSDYTTCNRLQINKQVHTLLKGITLFNMRKVHFSHNDMIAFDKLEYWQHFVKWESSGKLAQ